MGNNIKSDNNPISKGSISGITKSELSDSRTDNGSGETILIKRKRGRPKGSKNRPKEYLANGFRGNDQEGNERIVTPETREQGGEQQGDETTVFVQNQKTGKKRGRKPLVQKIENPGETAETVINTIELAAIQFIGEEARLEPFERFLIEIGATDTISKVSPETAARVASIVSPICLIGGLAIYGFRMAGVMSERMQAQKQPTMKQSDSEFKHEETKPTDQNPLPPQNIFNISDSIVPPMSKLNDLGNN